VLCPLSLHWRREAALNTRADAMATGDVRQDAVESTASVGFRGISRFPDQDQAIHVPAVILRALRAVGKAGAGGGDEGRQARPSHC
jgi:hypothetical protein